MRRSAFLLHQLFKCFSLWAVAAHAEDKPTAAIAMHGAAKYAAGFEHFDYVNPDAPKGGTLQLGVNGSFDSFNPFIVRGQPAMGLNTGYLSLIYEPLMARSADEPFTLYGLIAESVEVPDDRSSITFNLNPKAHFSDGQPITADDVLFSFAILRDKGRPNTRTYYKKVEKAEKLGPLRVKFTFKPNADGSIDREMPLIMGLMPVLPQHDWQGAQFQSNQLCIFPLAPGPTNYRRSRRGVPSPTRAIRIIGAAICRSSAGSIISIRYASIITAMKAFRWRLSRLGNMICAVKPISTNGRRLMIFLPRMTGA